MDWIKLSEPVKAHLVLSPKTLKTRRHRRLEYLWLGHLFRSSNNGKIPDKIPVEILAFRDAPAGRLCLFRPLGYPGIIREALIALMQYFAPPASPSEELLSLE